MCDYLRVRMLEMIVPLDTWIFQSFSIATFGQELSSCTATEGHHILQEMRLEQRTHDWSWFSMWLGHAWATAMFPHVSTSLCSKSLVMVAFVSLWHPRMELAHHMKGNIGQLAVFTGNGPVPAPQLPGGSQPITVTTMEPMVHGFLKACTGKKPWHTI